MKSIMEEGSSIVKAVEKAWTRAGKPQEFSVKVFEESKRNFFGFTIQSAKIAIFFDEKKMPHVATTRKEHARDVTPSARTSSERSGDMRDRNQRYERPERNDRHDRNDRNDRHDRNERNDRNDRNERNDRYEQGDRSRDSRRDQSPRAPQQRPERARADKMDRVERQERAPHHAERHTDRNDRPEFAERPERTAYAEQPVERMPERAKAPEHRPAHHIPEAQPVSQTVARLDIQEIKPTPPASVETTASEHTASQPSPNRWTPEMVQFAHNWMNHVFSQAGYAHTIALTVSEDSLFFTLPKTVMTDKEKEQALFRNCSHLIMAALRNSFDTDFRDMKVVITSS